MLLTTVLLLGVGLFARFDLARITSGVYRHGIVPHSGDYDFLFYRDGRTATVSVRRSADGFTTLATNGKPDASMEAAWLKPEGKPGFLRQITRDLSSQLLLPIITLAHAPLARNIAIIGHGSGMSSHVLLGSPHARDVVTIEIEPEMIQASRAFRPANSRVFDDPRSRFVIDDAKSYFASSGRTFDLILSEPSNPWVSGVSGLFTLEFYRRVQRQLAPGGVFGQWLHLYELSDGLVTSVLAAIDSVFPAYEIFYSSNADLLVVAGNSRVPAPDWNVVQYPGLAQDLRPVVPLTPELFESLRLAGRDVIHPFLRAEGAANSDYFPILDLGAERMRFLGESASGYVGLSEGRFDVVAALAGRPRGFGTRAVSATPDIPRPAALTLSTRMRALRTLPASETASVPRDAELRSALYSLDAFERVSTGSRPPTDWHEWTQALVRSDADLHGGTAGVIDSAFFRHAADFADRAGAPAEARAAVDFLAGIGSWNWPRTVAAAATLIASADAESWIPDALLRDGTAVAHLKLGNPAAAAGVLREFANRTTDELFRERLIEAYANSAKGAPRSRVGSR